jgi:hypothetical protein
LLKILINGDEREALPVVVRARPPTTMRIVRKVPDDPCFDAKSAMFSLVEVQLTDNYSNPCDDGLEVRLSANVAEETGNGRDLRFASSTATTAETKVRSSSSSSSSPSSSYDSSSICLC